MPRFVILTHDHPFLHWDLLLERGDVLRSWRLLVPPESDEAVPAEPLADHRRMYLDYEGPVRGDRGDVRRWDHGRYVLLVETPTRVEADFQGGRISGRVVLRADELGGNWTFHREA